jgi:hypothetical protein
MGRGQTVIRGHDHTSAAALSPVDEIDEVDDPEIRSIESVHLPEQESLHIQISSTSSTSSTDDGRNNNGKQRK